MEHQSELERLRSEAGLLTSKIVEHENQVAYARQHGTGYEPDPGIKDTRDRLLFLRARIYRLDQPPAR